MADANHGQTNKNNSHFRGRVVQLETVEGTTLYVHADILDSGRGVCPDVPWDSFKTSTVERFLEYCYQGDYSCPKPVKVPLATPTSSVDDHDEYADSVCHPRTDYLRGCRCMNHRVSLQDFLKDCNTEDDDTEYAVSAYESSRDDDSPGYYEESDTEGGHKDDSGSSEHSRGLDYGAVFLAHAELYILSQHQGRSSLTLLCLGRLRSALDQASRTPVRPRFASNMSDLLLYVYEHANVILIDDHKMHDLQNLVSSWAAMHIKEMKEEFSSLMRCGGKLAEDLMKVVVDRMISLESASKEKTKNREYGRGNLGGVNIDAFTRHSDTPTPTTSGW